MGSSRRSVLIAYAVGCVIAWSLVTYSPVVDESSAYVIHPAIYITDDSEFTPANGVVSGSGTEGDPFVISGWNVTDFGVAVEIIDTDAHYVISDCFVHDSGGYSILLVNAHNGTVTGCNVSSNYYGVIVNSCSNVTISQNVISSNTVDGLDVLDSQDVRVLDNLIQLNADDGFFEWGGSGILEITGNTIVNNLDSGIEVSHAALIARNTIADNDWYGVGLVGSGSTVYHNNIAGNLIQAFQNDIDDNAWDNGYPEGGNYWSDYVGVDNKSGPVQDQPGSDGIGDTPRVVPIAHADRYPLIEPFETNRPPVASFEVIPANGDTSTVFEFNATSSWDYESSDDDLMYRWDWDGDDTWDTGWLTESTVPHQFFSQGSYPVKLEVKDASNSTGNTTVQVDVAEVIPEMPTLVLPAVVILAALLVFRTATSKARDGRKGRE